MLRIRPIGQKEAFAWINATHRHLDAPRGWKFGTSLYRDGEMVGVACGGRPSSRLLDPTEWIEIQRVATDGTKNACTKLYAAICRAAEAVGYEWAITYTLPEEGGASLRAAGFVDDGLTDGGEWSRKGRPRAKALRSEPKRRWKRKLNP